MLRIGMLGAGGIAKAHVNAFRTIPYMFWPGTVRPALAAIAGAATSRACARRPSATASTATRPTGAPSPATRASTSSTTSGPDALHVEPTLAAIEAGKHVACEKPLALSAADCERLWRAAEARGVKHLACFNYRFLPAVRLARTLIEQGELGEVFEARFRYSQHRGMDPAAPPWVVGTLHAIGCHVIDQARFLVGEIAGVSAVLRGPMSERRAAAGVDPGIAIDSAHMVVEFAERRRGRARHVVRRERAPQPPRLGDQRLARQRGLGSRGPQRACACSSAAATPGSTASPTSSSARTSTRSPACGGTRRTCSAGSTGTSTCSPTSRSAVVTAAGGRALRCDVPRRGAARRRCPRRRCRRRAAAAASPVDALAGPALTPARSA